MSIALALENLTKIYANGTPALKDVNLTVEEGDFFALLGPNGAGKSTTIGIITSLINKTAGQVTIFGHEQKTLASIAKAKACLGVVPQEFNLDIFETVLNILLNQAGFYGIARKSALKLAEHYLTQLGLWEKRHAQARTLSGGMKRRLMIARALVHQPKLLILDEPTAGVDIELRRQLWDFLRDINQQGTTIILTTHYLEEAEMLCRNLAIIDHGKVITQGNVRALLNKLQIETFVFYLTKPLSLLPPNLMGRLVDELTLEVDVKVGQTLNEIWQVLQQQQISVSSMRNKTNRLEELFLRLTSVESVHD